MECPNPECKAILPSKTKTCPHCSMFIAAKTYHKVGCFSMIIGIVLTFISIVPSMGIINIIVFVLAVLAVVFFWGPTSTFLVSLRQYNEEPNGEEIGKMNREIMKKEFTRTIHTTQGEQNYFNIQTKESYNTPQAKQASSEKKFHIPFNKFYNSSFFQKLKYQKCPNSSCDFLVTTHFESCPKCGIGDHSKKETLNQKNEHIEEKILKIKNRINKLNQIIEDQKKYELNDLAQSTTLAMQKLVRQKAGFQLKQWDLKLVLLVNQIEPLTKNWRKLGELLEKQENEFEQITKYHKTNIDSLDNLKAEFNENDFQT
ncbi:MAG: hypothetical protein ACI86H_002698, partial [bacterium]